MLQQLEGAALSPQPSNTSHAKIPKEVVVQMVQNFVDYTYKSRNGTVSKVTHDNDAHCVFYPKKELDELFERNGYVPGSDPGAWGLRIYFGFHTMSALEQQYMPNRIPEMINNHTAILVCTVNKVDILDIGNSVATATEEGQICPPPLPCGSIQTHLHP